MASKNPIPKSPIEKRPYTSMEIKRIQLNPEQAVLSCCDNLVRAGVNTTMGAQCWPGPQCIEDPGTAYHDSSS